MDLSILNRRSFLKATAVTGLATALEASAAEGLVKQAEPAKMAKKSGRRRNSDRQDMLPRLYSQLRRACPRA